VRRLRRCAHSPKRDHDGHAQGISVTLIARRPLGFQGTRGDPGAASGWTAGAETAGHAAAPELPRAGQRELGPQDTWRSRSWPSVLTWSLYAGVPDLQGTDSGPRAHLGRVSEPVVGPTSLFPRCFFGTLHLGIRSGSSVLPVDAWRPGTRAMLRRAKRLLISPRTAEWKSWGLPSSESHGG
jgi:hypothetical protein